MTDGNLDNIMTSGSRHQPAIGGTTYINHLSIEHKELIKSAEAVIRMVEDVGSQLTPNAKKSDSYRSFYHGAMRAVIGARLEHGPAHAYRIGYECASKYLGRIEISPNEQLDTSWIARDLEMIASVHYSELP